MRPNVKLRAMTNYSVSQRTRSNFRELCKSSSTQAWPYALYVGRKCRFDVAATVAYLTARVGKADVSDLQKLQRLISHLQSTIDLEFILKPKGMFVEVFVDASHKSHSPKGNSHTGCAIALGGSFIHGRSVKQKNVAIAKPRSTRCLIPPE